MRRPALIFCLGVTSLYACQTYDPGEDVPARIINPTDASRAELQTAVNEALSSDVLLKRDALTTTSVLTIEQQQPSTLQNTQPVGRILDMPIQFRLLRNNSGCYLVDQRDQSRFLLENTDCVAE